MVRLQKSPQPFKEDNTPAVESEQNGATSALSSFPPTPPMSPPTKHGDMDQAVENKPLPRPPSYHETDPAIDLEDLIPPPDPTAGFAHLKFEKHKKSGMPHEAECIAHLKFLECLYRLRQTIASTDGLFGVTNDFITAADMSETGKAEHLAKLGEKRWAIYVNRSVDRFTAWWSWIYGRPENNCTPLSMESRLGEKLCAGQGARAIDLDREVLPPLDVLMVWHSYMLNPRDYLEDCLRNNKMDLWHTRMPWDIIAPAIDSHTFQYKANPEAEEFWKAQTGLDWDSLQDCAAKHVDCPGCMTKLSVSWTEFRPLGPGAVWTAGDVSSSVDRILSSGRGYCDRSFSVTCSKCRTSITHEVLEAERFKNDVRMLRSHSRPMGGTVLGVAGLPGWGFGVEDPTTRHFVKVPNALCQHKSLVDPLLNPLSNYDSLTKVRTLVEEICGDKKVTRQIREDGRSSLWRMEKVAIRRMLSRYWGNSSPFALDLVGAVIRQGSFVSKMHDIDWLHSPAVKSTARRLVLKYQNFMRLIMWYKGRMAVPTLDVDLAWHTHQLSPARYMEYSVLGNNTLINHDDKVSEVKLNDQFAWTSSAYQKLYDEPYSECTCWYCEAVRESHTHGITRFFSGRAVRATEKLHDAPDTDPSKMLHISSHNAIRPTGDSGAHANMYSHYSAKQARDLEYHYQRACERAKKKGRPPPKRSDYYYSDAYGYPVYIPAIGYLPYYPAYYPVTPGCATLVAGAAGNCCAGMCAVGGSSDLVGSAPTGGACSGGGCSNGGSCGGGGGGGGCGGGGGGGCGGG